MSLTALALLVAAAILHASWNLLVKQAAEKTIFTGWALSSGALLLAPIVVWSGPVPARAWPYVLASGLCEAAYFFTLTASYRLADFSLVYPLARGGAPALMALGAIVWLREDLRSRGLLGLGLLVLGLLLVGASARKQGEGSLARPSAGLLAALAVAVLIALYTLIDGAAVRFVPPAVYNSLVFVTSAIFLTPVVLVRYGRRTLVAELRLRWPRIVAVGVLMVLSYGLVLYAYTLAPVGYAGAVREVSVVFAAFAGWRWLGEPLGRRRLAGAVLIFAGIGLIALA